jgi:hypothetical protein
MVGGMGKIGFGSKSKGLTEKGDIQKVLRRHSSLTHPPSLPPSLPPLPLRRTEKGKLPIKTEMAPLEALVSRGWRLLRTFSATFSFRSSG